MSAQRYARAFLLRRQLSSVLLQTNIKFWTVISLIAQFFKIVSFKNLDKENDRMKLNRIDQKQNVVYFFQIP